MAVNCGDHGNFCVIFTKKTCDLVPSPLMLYCYPLGFVFFPGQGRERWLLVTEAWLGRYE